MAKKKTVPAEGGWKFILPVGMLTLLAKAAELDQELARAVRVIEEAEKAPELDLETCTEADLRAELARLEVLTDILLGRE